jgi:hypothetical protein
MDSASSAGGHRRKYLFRCGLLLPGSAPERACLRQPAQDRPELPRRAEGHGGCAGQVAVQQCPRNAVLVPYEVRGSDAEFIGDRSGVQSPLKPSVDLPKSRVVGLKQRRKLRPDVRSRLDGSGIQRFGGGRRVDLGCLWLTVHAYQFARYCSHRAPQVLQRCTYRDRSLLAGPYLGPSFGAGFLGYPDGSCEYFSQRSPTCLADYVYQRRRPEFDLARRIAGNDGSQE